MRVGHAGGIAIDSSARAPPASSSNTQPTGPIEQCHSRSLARAWPGRAAAGWAGPHPSTR
jgi:hypothetical protein